MIYAYQDNLKSRFYEIFFQFHFNHYFQKYIVEGRKIAFLPHLHILIRSISPISFHLAPPAMYPRSLTFNLPHFPFTWPLRQCSLARYLSIFPIFLSPGPSGNVPSLATFSSPHSYLSFGPSETVYSPFCSRSA